MPDTDHNANNDTDNDADTDADADTISTEPMPPVLNLAHHFLVAMPHMDDGLFARSVVYVCEHSERGALGLVVNKPGKLSLAALLEKIDLSLARKDLQDQPIYQGGPVQIDRGFVLHDPVVLDAPHSNEAAYASTLSIPGGLELTTSKDVLEAVSHGAGPKRVLVALGYSSWAEGQLESELRENAWLTIEAGKHTGIIFDTPPEQRYEAVLDLLGLKPWMLHSEAGNA